MKTFITNQKKWILPSLLVATLAVNAYNQTTSLIYGSADLASKAEDTEATTAKLGVCKDGKCELTQEQFNDMMNFIRATKDQQANTQKAQLAKNQKSEKSEDEEQPKETAKEKRERLAQEKNDKIKEEFDAKIEKLSEKCDGKDLDCATSGLTSLLNRYTGSKKLDSATVSAAYSKLLGKPLREALKNSDTDTLTALADLVNDIPKEYQALRTKTLEIVKLDTQLKAQQVNNEFKMADQAFKQRDVQSQQQHLSAAQVGLQKLQQSTNGFVQTVASNATYEQDNVTLNYLKENFDMNKLFANITNVNSTNNANQSQNQSQIGNQNQIGNNQQGQGTVQQTGQSTRQSGARNGVPFQGGMPGNGQMTGNQQNMMQQQPIYNQMNMNQNMLQQQQFQQPMYNNGTNPQMMNPATTGYPQQGGGVSFRGTRQ